MCTCVVELDVHVLNFNVHCARSVRCAHVLDVQVLNMQCAGVKLKCACVLELDVQERAME